MGRKYFCLQFIPLNAAILLGLATERWFGAMDLGQFAKTILESFVCWKKAVLSRFAVQR